MKLSDSIDRKFTEVFDSAEWQVETETGYEDIISSNKTIEYEIYEIVLDNGMSLKCADTHILIDSNYAEIFAKDSLGHIIRTRLGNSAVVSVASLGYTEPMYDLSVDSKEHTFYTNGILSHNTQTVAAYILHYTIFNDNKTVAILANKAAMAREILSRYQQMFECLPAWLQQGVSTYNKGDIKLENGSIVFTAATSTSGIRGRSVSLLYIDEVAIIPNTVAEEFFTSTYPTISSGKTSKIILTSTPLGYNHFWHFWQGAEAGTNGFTPVLVHYSEHPNRDDEWARKQKDMLGETKFAQEVLTTFLGSSLTLISADIYGKLVPKDFLYMKDGLDIAATPVKGNNYVIVADTAKGVGGDYSAFIIVDITSFPYIVVGKYRNNKISPLLYPNVIYKVAKEYNNADVLVEINSSEQVIHILHDELEYENILYVQRSTKGQTASAGFGGSGRTQLGVITDKKVKRIGCQTFKSLLEGNKILLSDPDIISEISTFIERKGTYMADEGYCDDLVMTLVLFSWLTTNPYFKDLNNINIREMLYKQQMQQIEDELTPIGWFNDGIDEEPVNLNF